MKLILLKTIQYSIDIRSEALGGRGVIKFLSWNTSVLLILEVIFLWSTKYVDKTQIDKIRISFVYVEKKKKGIKYFIL